ncbi:uncharacterized protein LOC132945734 [Metopolophium dirhodum]|uniref:uncharacterized protein LOC132945734 n=1 Tax=Metopolophium dirhodum TaxID=44670 RepID=UPI00298F774D|nr:uncharacterized protein LOC132945734 [Metopolophium dirhodum]
MSNQICCVVGCTNTYKNTTNVSFFRFPGKPHEILQENKWIQAVKRKSSNNQPWKPNQNSRICSEHFIDGKPSKHPNSPSFYPTIFPKIYKQNVPAQESVSRFNRLQKRKSCNTIISTNSRISNNLTVSNELVCPDVVKHTEDKSTQTSMNLINNSFEFSCVFSNNNVNTQANIVGLDSIYFKPKMVDKCEGSVNYDILEYFSGFKSLKNESHLISLCGVNFETFNIFLNLKFKL